MIHRLTLCNFKYFRNATLDLGPFTVLVGANASGKSTVRAEPNPKEAFFDPYVAEKGIDRTPGSAREVLGREIPAGYSRVRYLCDEVASLETRIREIVDAV